MIARNLAICPPDQKQLVAPCAACFLNLKKTDHLMAEHADMCGKVNAALAAGSPVPAAFLRETETLYDDLAGRVLGITLEQQPAPSDGEQPLEARLKTICFSPELRKADPTAAAKAVGYVGAGTVEFLLGADRRRTAKNDAAQ